MQNHEFTFKEYLIALLHRLNLLVLSALVFACLLGALSYFNYINNSESIQEDYNKRLERFEDELNTKLSQSEYHRGVAAAAEKYNENSLLMQMDPYDKRVAMLNLSIRADPIINAQISSGSSADYVGMRDYLLQNIISRYLVLANNANLGQILKDILPRSYDETFLREIVRIERYTESGKIPSDDQGILSITAFGTKEIDAKQVVDTIRVYLESRKELVETAVQAHELVVFDENSYSTVDNDLVKLQAEQRNLVNESNQSAIKFLKEAEALRGNRPQNTSLVPGVLKNALVGAVLGGAIGIFFVALACRLRSPLQYVQQLQELMGLNFLGGFKSKRRSLFAWLSRRLAGEQALSGDQEVRQIIAANVEAAAQGLSTVLLTGTVAEDELKALADNISVNMQSKELEILYGGNLNQYADTVRKLSESEAVIFVERLQQTQLEEVRRQKLRVELSGKPILGYILC